MHTAYKPWTQFGAFPQFMEGVREVRQIDDTHMHWRAEIAGKDVEWEANIAEQEPDQRIAWRTASGPRSAGIITFHEIEPQKTKRMAQVDYEPEGTVENIGSALGSVRRRVEGDRERFKDFAESRGAETRALRGEVKQSN